MLDIRKKEVGSKAASLLIWNTNECFYQLAELQDEEIFVDSQ